MFAGIWKSINQRLLENSVGSGLSLTLALVTLLGLLQIEASRLYLLSAFLDQTGSARLVLVAFAFLGLAFTFSELLARLSARYRWRLFSVDLHRARNLYGFVVTALVVALIFYISMLLLGGAWWQGFGRLLGAAMAGGFAYYVFAFVGSLIGRAHPQFGLTQASLELDYFFTKFRPSAKSLPLVMQKTYAEQLVRLDSFMAYRMTDDAVSCLIEISSQLAENDRLDLAVSMLNDAGERLTHVGKFEQALELHKNCVGLKRKQETFSPLDIVDDLMKLGMNASFANENDVAIESFLSAKDICLEFKPDDLTALLAIDQGLAQSYISSEQHPEALQLLTEAVEICEASGDRVPIQTAAMLRRSLGIVYQKLGDVERGKALVRESVEQLLSGIDLDSVQLTSIEQDELGS